MPIGDIDSQGNTLLLGGWKADFYQTPTNSFLIRLVGGGSEDTLFKEEGKALTLYNELNGTNLQGVPRLPKLERDEISIGLPILPPGSRILGKFESFSEKGKFHYVIETEEKSVYCTCTGFGVHHHCWHHTMIMTLDRKKIPDTIIVRIKVNRG